MGNGTQTWLRNLTSWIGRVWLWSLRFCSSGATSIVNGLWLKGIAMPNLERHSTFNFYIEWWRKNNWTGQSRDVWWCMMYDVWCMMYDVWCMMYDVWCMCFLFANITCLHQVCGFTSWSGILLWAVCCCHMKRDGRFVSNLMQSLDVSTWPPTYSRN